jgi:hypothetical protein
MISYILLSASVFVNIFLIWYVRELLIEFSYMTERFRGLSQSIENYQEHLSTVYGLETFYGDTTLGSLLQHTGDLSNEIKDWREGFEIQEE